MWKCICPVIEIWPLPLKNASCAPEVRVFPLFLSTFFSVFTQTTDQKSVCSCHILTNILSINYNCFVTKKPPNNIPFRKLSLSWKEHSKIRKEHVFRKHVLLIRFFQIPVMQGYGELCYIKGVQKQPFADVLRNWWPWKFLQNSQENICVGVAF